MELYASGFLVDPSAEVVHASDDTWWIVVNPDELMPVLPSGVLPDVDPGEGLPIGGEDAAPLGRTLHGVFENLRSAFLDSKGNTDKATRLEEHFRRLSVPSLCGHGLLPWADHNGLEPIDGHRWAPNSPCGLASVPGDGRPGVALAHVERMIVTMTAITDAAEQLHQHRMGLRRRKVDDLLEWPILPAHLAERVERARSADGGLPLRESRLLIARLLRHLFHASAVQIHPRWPQQRRIQVGYTTRTTTGAYAVDLVRHLNPVDDNDHTYECWNCGEPFSPGRPLKANESRYCRLDECRRARNSRKSRAARRRRTEDGEHQEAR